MRPPAGRRASCPSRPAPSPVPAAEKARPPTGEVRLWDVATGRQLGPALNHPEPAWGAAFTGDGRKVITAGADRHGRLWSAETGELLSQFLTPVFAGNAR